MDIPSGDIIQLLSFLLPGLIAAWIYGGLTPTPSVSAFERTAQALIFTALVKVTVSVVAILWALLQTRVSLGRWSMDTEFACSVAVAVALGLFVAYCTNNDTFHSAMRRAGITRLNSYPSEWYSAFRHPRYVVLHLKGERRLYCWPEEWPTDPKSGHFIVTEAEWLLTVGGKNESKPLSGVERVVVPVDQVEMVEFMAWPTDTPLASDKEGSNGKGTATGAKGAQPKG